MFSDLRRIKKLGKYLTKDKKTIYLILIVLLPVAFSGAIISWSSNYYSEERNYRCLAK